MTSKECHEQANSVIHACDAAAVSYQKAKVFRKSAMIIGENFKATIKIYSEEAVHDDAPNEICH